MTKHSSSQVELRMVLLDSICRPVPLGKQVGRGGEGSVYEVEGDSSLVAKVYHKKPLPEDQVAKIQAMVSCWSKALETIAAWPRSMLFDSGSRKPWGILMTKMEGARPLHELYGTTNRRRHFPDVGWHHLVLAARNTAAAFQTLHSANIIVGDVNQGNLLVDQGMCVRMIDCDSFQLTSNGRTFGCPVGTPHFTPPELQSLKLREVMRSPNHDRFGLAVLLFHLLFVGRHPFAGRYRGLGDLSIEKAIAERRFAFSQDKAATLVDPPPASLLLDDLPASLGDLFERAFRSEDGDANGRPTPLQWVQELDALMKRRKSCNLDSSHVYYSQLAECPWCRIEDTGGPTFFVASGGTTIVSADRLAVLDSRIWDLPEIQFADLPSQRLARPNMPALKSLKKMKRGWPDWLVLLLTASWACSLAGAIVGGMTGVMVLAGGALVALALSASLIVNRQARSRRKTRDDYEAWLQKSQQALSKRARAIEFHHHQREQTFERSTEELKKEFHLYRNAAENLKDVIVQLRESQRAEYLRSFLVRDHFRKIPGITPSHVTMLESFGLESANDIDRLWLYGIPGIEPETVVDLLAWRKEVEKGFVFNPEHGLTLNSVGMTKELAVRKFKISQARKILAGAKQIEGMADVAESQLERDVAQFDQAAEKWKATAKQFRDVQSARRRLERAINKSPAVIIGLTLGVAFAALLIYLIRG